jgi:hypothetical protein
MYFQLDLFTPTDPPVQSERGVSDKPAGSLERRRSRRKSVRSDAAEEAIRVSSKGRYQRK